MKKLLLSVLILTLCFSLFACGKPQNVINAAKAYKEIGEVTLDSAEKITAAEAALTALTDEEKSKYPDVAEKIAKKRSEYDALVKAKELQEKIDGIIKGIDELGTITLASSSSVSKLWSDYNSLSEADRAIVTNKDKLEAAKTQLSELQKAEKQKIIAEKTPLFTVEADKVEGVTWYTPKAMPQYIDIRSYVIPYVGVKNGSPWIVTRYNYTGDDWVFWKTITIVADGKKYYKTFSYYDIVHDNDGGEVWEYYDDALAADLPMSNSDIEMLAAIANSKETIVRFEGDDYSRDLTITAADKTTIKNVLAFYEALTWK